ncbi:hypothetical protein CROQUDRAFT_13854, partial [Cronartium quercuum f. sp. fusiforme G11]
PLCPQPLVFTKPPKGLPLDFHNIDWFNEALSNSQKQDIADIHSVMFLTDATHSLLGKAHPDKKFTQKYWDEATKDYSMEHTVVDVESKDDNEQSDDD